MLSVVNRIHNIGFNSFKDISLYEQKRRKLFNILTAVGVFIAVFHFTVNYSLDPVAAYFHLSWGLFCIIGLLIHSKGHFLISKVVVCFTIITLGGMASARIGAEYYAHFPMFGIYIATFLFFDIKKEWEYLLLMTIAAIGVIIVTESGIFKAASIELENVVVLRTIMLIATHLFVAFEIIYLMRYSALNEKEMNNELLKSNENLRELNQQKTLLLQEIHHRVKNNLQFIISLLNLHSKEITDDKAKAMTEDFMMRLHSISIMHQMMYTSKTIGEINLEDFAQKLVENMKQSYKSEKNVAISVESSVEKISNQAIVPLSLIIHELIANSFEHAFSIPNKKNEIKISFKKNGKQFDLIYQDNGVWKENEKKQFGSDLIKMLTDQLSGEVDFRASDEGTIYRFHFEL